MGPAASASVGASGDWRRFTIEHLRRQPVRSVATDTSFTEAGVSKNRFALFLLDTHTITICSERDTSWFLVFPTKLFDSKPVHFFYFSKIYLFVQSTYSPIETSTPNYPFTQNLNISYSLLSIMCRIYLIWSDLKHNLSPINVDSGVSLPVEYNSCPNTDSKALSLPKCLH